MEPKQPLRILTADLLIADLSAEKNDQLEAVLNKYGLKKDGKRSANEVGRYVMEKHDREQGREPIPKDMPIPPERREEFDKYIEEIYSDFSNAAKYKFSPGGSSFNVASTLTKTLNTEGQPKDVEVRFFGVTGGDYATKIDDALKSGGIERIPELPPGTKVNPALSFVVKYPPEHPGDAVGRTIVTFRGTAAEVIKPHLITRGMLEGDDNNPPMDALLVQGSLRSKLQKTQAVHAGYAPEDKLGFADKLLKLRWETGKNLWLTLPTTAVFNPESNGYFQDLIRSANLILSNDEELSRVYTEEDEHKSINTIIAERGLQVEKRKGHEKEPTEAEKIETGRDIMRDHRIGFNDVFNFYDPIENNFNAGERKAIEGMLIVLRERHITKLNFTQFDFEHKSITPEEAFVRLGHIMAKKYLESQEAKDKGWKKDDTGQGFSTDQVAFITRGKRGAVVLGKDAMGVIDMEEVKPVNPKKIESTLGAGDTSFAGFIAGHIKGLSPVESAQIGMALAAKKLEVNEAQLPDPKSALVEAVKELKLNANIANKLLPAEVNGYHHLVRREVPLTVLNHVCKPAAPVTR